MSHGGKRPGSGRPRKTDKKVAITVYVHPETRRKIVDYLGLPSLAEMLDNEWLNKSE